jgi:hypothetical protein
LWRVPLPASFDVRQPPDFLVRAMVAIAVVSRHPAQHFVESGVALLRFARISTPNAAAVVMRFELWWIAMRSGACTSERLVQTRPSVELTPNAWRFWRWYAHEFQMLRISKCVRGKC